VLKALLLRSVDPKSAFTGTTTSGGRLNANTAVRCNAAPKVWIESPEPGFKVSVGEPVTVKAIGTNCADPSGVAVSVSANGTILTLTSRGDGLYSGTYTPSALGAIRFDVTATVGATSDTRTVSGVAEDNYRFADAPYSWVDATAGGTQLSLGDDTSATVSLPFSFSFYRQSFSSLKVSSNGYVNFGASAATAWTNADVPSPTPPNGFVAPLWDDLNPSAGGGVWYRTIGSSPNRRFVVAWVGVRHYLNAGTATFELVLEEGTNDLVLQYQDVDFGNSFDDFGASATVGVENLDGTVGRKFLYDQALLQPYQGAKALRFTMAPPGSSDITPPAAPTGLTATAGNSLVVLDWANSTEADLGGYRVFRRSSGGVWPAAPLATVATSAYTDTGLTNGTTYDYRVTAYDTSNNESLPSGVVSATPVAPPMPTVKSYNPAGYTIAAGALFGSTGAITRLYSNDATRVEINSTTSGNPRVSELQPYASITPSERASLSRLTVNFDASVSNANASLSFRVCRWNGTSTCTWETVSSYGTGSTSDRSFTWAITSPASYVSPSGEIRVSVRGTRNSSTFRTRTDWVRFTIEY
jgi:hypothetical protein